jgi:uncharacterized RDD family membrane protein YckC
MGSDAIVSFMSGKKRRPRRRFHAHETARVDSLNGRLLASFWQRLVAYGIDLLVATLLFAPVEFVWQRYIEHKEDVVIKLDFHEWHSLIVIVLYFGLCVYFFNGKTLGKWITRIRIVSLTQERISLWQATERALGYGASVLEAGFGFLQFFINRNRQCVHDRIAETIVVDERAGALHVVDAVLNGDLGEGDAGGGGLAGGEHAGEVQRGVAVL